MCLQCGIPCTAIQVRGFKKAHNPLYINFVSPQTGKPPEGPSFLAPSLVPADDKMAARLVGSLETEALSACSGTLDGSDSIEVALLRSRNDDNTAEVKNKGNKQRYITTNKV